MLWKDPGPRPQFLGANFQHRSRMLFDSTTVSEDEFRAPMVFRRSRASMESPPTFTSNLWLPEAVGVRKGLLFRGWGRMGTGGCGGGGQGIEICCMGPSVCSQNANPPCCRYKGGLETEAPRRQLSDCRAEI